jgi:hypothetical protein
MCEDEDPKKPGDAETQDDSGGNSPPPKPPKKPEPTE